MPNLDLTQQPKLTGPDRLAQPVHAFLGRHAWLITEILFRP